MSDIPQVPEVVLSRNIAAGEAEIAAADDLYALGVCTDNPDDLPSETTES